MNIVFDCDEVILNTAAAMRQWYLITVDPLAEIPDNCYPSNWPVWGDFGTPAAKQNWLDHMQYFSSSSYFNEISSVPGAIDGIRRVKNNGNNLYVLSGISSDSKVQRHRKNQLVEIFGPNIFSEVICIGPVDSKKQVLKDLKTNILVDDGPTNISDALELGIHGIWKRCPENSYIMDSIIAGKSIDIGFWKADRKIVREKAKIANSWDDIEKIIYEIQHTKQR